MTYGVTWGEGAPDIASLTGTPAITFGTTYVAGSGLTLLDSSAQIKFPSALMSTANASTLTLTDSGTDQTLTASLGFLKVISADSGTVFSTLANNSGTTVATVNVDTTITNQLGGLISNFVAAAGTLTAKTCFSWDGKLVFTSGILTTCILAPYHQSGFTVALTAGSGTDNKAYSTNLVGPIIANANGGWTEVAGINITGPRRSLSNPTVTSASTVVMECPTISATQQAGIYIKQRTAQQVAANRDGILMDAMNSGTSRRAIRVSNTIEDTTSDFYCGTAAKGLLNKDTQATPEYWRTYVDSTGATVGGVTMSVDAFGVLTVTRLGTPTGALNLQIADAGTVAPTT